MASSSPSRRARETIPASVGIGLRAPHYRELVETRPAVGWLEAHSENFFGAGGAPLRYLEQARADYPVSLHGVGLSLGSADPLNPLHLDRLAALVRRIEPGLVSEHLSWSSVGGRWLNDLLPLPYTEEALALVVERVAQAQEFLGRRILLENPSSYLEFADAALPEWEFLAETARRSGCGILLDVNNLYVSCRNHGWNPLHYLAAIPPALVEEIHLAGHLLNRFEEGEILIDTHDRPVCPAVWSLYRETLRWIGPKPTLIEWDAELPPLSALLGEAAQAQALLDAEASHARAA
jgi:uncharacterized protein (UPF0276 family)